MSMRLLRGRSTPSMRAMVYPCRCLCLGVTQITRTTPRRRMTRHLSQMTFTEALTFTFCSSPASRPVHRMVVPRSGGGGRQGQDLRPGRGDGDGVFEVGRTATIFGHDRP